MKNDTKMVIGIILTIVLGLVGTAIVVESILGALPVRTTTEYSGIVQQKYTQMVGGTETYHLIVKTANATLDATVSGLDYYSKYSVGDKYTWSATTFVVSAQPFGLLIVVVGVILLVLGICAVPMRVAERHSYE